MTADSSVLSVIYKTRGAIGLRVVICTIEYDALAYTGTVQITRSVYQLKLAVGDATETTVAVAAVKSATGHLF